VKIPWCSSERFGIIVDNNFPGGLTWAPNRRRSRQQPRRFFLCFAARISFLCETNGNWYLSCIQPIMTYGSGARIYDPTAISSALQMRQNELLRVRAMAPWFVRNAALHRDLQLDFLNIVFQLHTVVLYDRLTRPTNRLLVSELINEPTLRYPRDAHKR
jgi:hypothetical protein